MNATPFSIPSLWSNIERQLALWGDWGLILGLFALCFSLLALFAFTCWIGGGVRDMIERRRDYMARYRARG